jgi:ABC-2 type transport system ATP-binding protein
MVTLELQGLGRRHGRRWALRGANLSVEEGEIVALWGGSGSGKTTLLHLLAALLRPSEGRARVDGHDLRLHPQRVRAAVGIAFQIPAFDPWLTALEGLEMRAAMHGVARSHRTNQIVRLIHLVGMEEFHETPVRMLSPSQRRRLEVAAALLTEPRVLFLDEPFVGLDSETIHRVWEFLLDLRGRGRTTLLVATSRAEVAERCHRIGVLHGGRLVAVDTPDSIRGAAGKDVVTVQPLDERLTARRLQERLHVSVTEEENGYRVEVQRGDTVAADIVGSFGGQTAAVYVRRPSLEAGLRRSAIGAPDTLSDPLALEPELTGDE